MAILQKESRKEWSYFCTRDSISIFCIVTTPLAIHLQESIIMTSIINEKTQGVTVATSSTNESTADEHNGLTQSEATEILNHGNPIEYLMNEYGKIHVGDKDLGELLLMTVGCQLCSNTEGLQPDLSGESGKGKSDACKAMGHLLPQEYFITGSHSTLGLFHRDDVLEGAIVFLDDVEKFGDKEEQLIKTITSQYQLPFEHTYTNMGKRGAKKADTISMPPRATFWITSVGSYFDAQILNRFLKMHVDEGEEQDLAVFRQQQEYAKKGFNRYAVTPDVEISREMIRQLKGLEPVYVTIPYSDLIAWKGVNNRRNFSMFVDIIKASAAINQFQRQKMADGSVVADLIDYDRATRLWNKIERAQTTGLTTKEQLVLSAINAGGNVGLSQSEIAAKCSIDKGTVSRAIHGIKQGNGTYKGGLMNKLKGGLSYNEVTKTYSCVGLKTSGENVVSLPNRQDAQAMIDSCTRLHAVATQMQPILST
jgi:hypothetical protein